MRLRKYQKIEAFNTLHTAVKMILAPWGSVLDPGTEEMCEFTDPEEHWEVVGVFLSNQSKNVSNIVD